MSVAFEELEGSPRIGIDQHGTSAVRTFRVAWADWQEFARALIGTYRIIGGAPQFLPPIQFPGLPNLIVSEVKIEPFDPDCPDGGAVSLGAATNQYTRGGAKVTATYRTAFDEDNSPRPDLPKVPKGTILTYSADLGAEYVATPGRVWHWKVSGSPKVPDDVNPGLLVPTGDFSLVWHRVPQPPWANIRGLRGKVNQTTFVGSPAGTVLFLGARASRQFQFVESGGYWRLEYRFAEITKELGSGGKVGWNYFYRRETTGGEHWVEIEDDSGRPPYLAGDFGGLFTFGS